MFFCAASRQLHAKNQELLHGASEELAEELRRKETIWGEKGISVPSCIVHLWLRKGCGGAERLDQVIYLSIGDTHGWGRHAGAEFGQLYGSPAG